MAAVAEILSAENVSLRRERLAVGTREVLAAEDVGPARPAITVVLSAEDIAVARGYAAARVMKILAAEHVGRAVAAVAVVLATENVGSGTELLRRVLGPDGATRQDGSHAEDQHAKHTQNFSKPREAFSHGGTPFCHG